jgi:hypothetical protein
MKILKGKIKKKICLFFINRYLLEKFLIRLKKFQIIRHSKNNLRSSIEIKIKIKKGKYFNCVNKWISSKNLKKQLNKL